ncbi:hypothetical protein FQN60_000213, partial [Etheostoma spectabile]
MARVPGSLTRSRTRSDAMAEVVSAESYPAVLESSPPGYVEKISRYFESSVGHSKQDKVPVCNGPAEAESDSGDSLFLTQKSVPEAVRSRRQRRHSLRSTPISPRDLEEPSRSEDSPSSSSHEESKTDKGRRRKKYTLPKYHFPFLAKCKHRSTLLPVQNASLHHYVMGGFFNCVRDLWQGYQRPHLEPSLPTVDERKHFVAPSKAKSKQTWCKPVKQQRRGEAGTETPDRGGSSSRVRGQRERNDEHRNFTLRSKTPKRRLTRENQASDKEPGNYNDAVCEPRKPQRKHSTPKTTVTEPQTDVSHVEDLFQAGQAGDRPERPSLPHSLSDLLIDPNNDSIRDEAQVKKRKKKKRGHHGSGDGGQSQSQEEPGGLHAGTSVNMDVEETPGPSGDNRAETPATQASDQVEYNERNGTENMSRDDKILSQEERDMLDSKHKRKKRKKNKSSSDVRQDVDGSFESDVRAEESVFTVSCNMKDGSKEKKKKKRKSGEDVEHFQSGAVAEPLNDDAEKPKRRKKKRKKEEELVIPEQCEEEEEEEEASNRTLNTPPVSTDQLEESGNCLESAAASQETSESSSVKRKKQKKKRQSSSNAAARDEEEGVDVSLCMDDSVTSAKGSGTSLEKKKTIFEGFDVSYTPEENPKTVTNTQKPKEGLGDQNAEMVTKEKKKKKKKMSRKISEDTVAQSDDCVSVQEKDRKRASAFLVADAEENDARAHGEHNAEKPLVSAGDLEQLHDGVTKKKRKRKMSEEHNVDCEDPNRTCQGALLELIDTGLKRRKKPRMGNESRSVTPAERLESTADVDEGAVVSKKKKKKKKKKREDEPCHLIQEGPPTATEDAEPVRSTLRTCPSVSPKKKGKHGRGAEETPDLVGRASASPETLGNQALNDRTDEKKKKKKKMKSTDSVVLEGRSLTKSA